MDRIKQKQPEEIMMRRILRPTLNRQQVNNTPIRLRDNNKENNLFPANRHKDISKNNESTDKNIPSPNASLQTSTTKTVMKKKVQVQGKICVNHSDAKAEFKITIDGDVLSYCSKCAAHLASNGFQVQRMGQTRSPIRTKEGRSPFSKRKTELNTFLSSLKQLERGYMEKQDLMRKVQGSYEIQKQTISNFYASMTEYLQFLRSEHLHFLQQEEQRHTQICEIETVQIAQTLQEISAMRQDIQSNVQKIVEDVDEQSYTECMAFYAQKRGLQEHRLEELGVDGRASSITSAECVQQKLNEFKGFIDDLTGIRNSKAESIDY